MRRLFSIFVAALFIALGMPAVNANTLITLTAPTTRLADSRFINNNLALSLSPDGELGGLFLNTGSGERTWLIDPAFIEEVLDLADGYVYLDAEGEEVTVESFDIAQQWFNLLKLNIMYGLIVNAQFVVLNAIKALSKTLKLFV